MYILSSRIHPLPAPYSQPPSTLAKACRGPRPFAISTVVRANTGPVCRGYQTTRNGGISAARRSANSIRRWNVRWTLGSRCCLCHISTLTAPTSPMVVGAQLSLRCMVSSQPTITLSRLSSGGEILRGRRQTLMNILLANGLPLRSDLKVMSIRLWKRLTAGKQNDSEGVCIRNAPHHRWLLTPDPHTPRRGWRSPVRTEARHLHAYSVHVHSRQWPISRDLAGDKWNCVES